MANKRLTMTTLRQIIRLRNSGKSCRAISHILGISRDSVSKYSSMFETSGLSYSDFEQMSDLELSKKFYNKKISSESDVSIDTKLEKLIESFPDMERQLSKVGMTRLRLWSRYKLENPKGYNYSSFCHHFHKWQKTSQVSMHFEHKSGDKMFVDFTGKKLHLTNPETGELTEVEVFVSILGASQLTYVEAVLSQKKEDFIMALENAIHYYGGVPQAIVPDNLKSAVHKSNKYEPLLNKTFDDFSHHYGTTILATRSYKPKDKALVEGAVKIVYNRIFAELSGMVFFNLTDLNNRIKEELEKYNSIKLTGKPSSRREIFESTERSELKALPVSRYEIKAYHQATVYKTSHIWFGKDKHYYSVPFHYIGKRVEIIYTKTMVEIYYKHERIASHVRDTKENAYTTVIQHLPSSHRFVSEWSPEKFLKWATEIGQPTLAYISSILQSKAHPEKGYKSCMGILSFVKKVGKDRLNSACLRASYYNSFNYMTVKNILEKRLDYIPIESEEQYKLPSHNNIRGSQYYK